MEKYFPTFRGDPVLRQRTIAERQEIMDSISPEHTSWRPKDNTRTWGRPNPLTVEARLVMSPQDCEKYLFGDMSDWKKLLKQNPEVALLAYLRQQGIVFHDEDMMLTTQGKMPDGGSILRTTIYDHLLHLNNTPLYSCGLIWDENYPDNFKFVEDTPLVQF